MADYVNIHGNNIEIRSADPTNPAEGQIWYNTTTNSLKGSINYGTGSWATGGTRNNDYPHGMNIGTISATTLAGGRTPAPPYVTTAVEDYDGTTWTNAPAMNREGEAGSGEGSQTAGIIAGAGWSGAAGKNNETYLRTGTTWTTGPSIPGVIKRYYGSAGGLAGQTASIRFNGEGQAPTPISNTTESWNGSTWTTVNPTGVSGESTRGFGTQTAALGFYGSGTLPYAKTAEYDGTSWTAAADFPITAYAQSTGGTQTAGIVTGSGGPPNNLTVFYDGTTWTVSPQTRPIGGAMNPAGQTGGQTGHIVTAVPSPTTTTLEWQSGTDTVTFSSS